MQKRIEVDFVVNKIYNDLSNGNAFKADFKNQEELKKGFVEIAKAKGQLTKKGNITQSGLKDIENMFLRAYKLDSKTIIDELYKILNKNPIEIPVKFAPPEMDLSKYISKNHKSLMETPNEQLIRQRMALERANNAGLINPDYNSHKNSSLFTERQESFAKKLNYDDLFKLLSREKEHKKEMQEMGPRELYKFLHRQNRLISDWGESPREIRERVIASDMGHLPELQLLRDLNVDLSGLSPKDLYKEFNRMSRLARNRYSDEILPLLPSVSDGSSSDLRPELEEFQKTIGGLNNNSGLSDTIHNTAEELRDLAKATDTASTNIGDLSDAQKNAAKKEEIKQKKIASLNERYDLGIDAKATPENLHKLLQGQLFDLSYEMAGITEKYGKHRDKWSDEIAAKYDSLKSMSDDIRMADSSVSRAQSSSTYAAHEDAMQVAMYSSAYQRLYGKADKRSMTEIQKGFVKQTLSEISQLDLKNPINDGLKKLIPNVLENVNMTGFSLGGTAKQNSVFWEFAKNTDAFKKYSETLKLSEPNITDEEIKKRFMKDKMQRAKATGDIIKGDQKNGTNNMALITKAGSGLFLAANIGVKAIESLSKVIIKLGEESVVAFENIQALQTQLGVVFSSQGEASNMFQKFADYAVVSPFGVNTMVQQGIQLKQSGVGGSELLDTMKRIGDISSGNQEKMKSISDVYSRVMASTTVTARDMRQLVNAGVPAYDALTKAMQENPNGRNISRSNIRSLLQSGKVTSEDFQLMLKNLTDEGGMFYGATKVGAKTLKARKQNLSDIRELALAAVGESITTGGQDLSSTFYGKLLSVQEHAWTWLRDEFNKGIKTKQVDYQKEKLEKYKRYTDMLESTDISDVQKKLISELRGDYNYADYVRAASEYYNANIPKQKVVSDSEYELINEAYNSMKSILAGSYGEDSLDQFNSLRKVNHYANMDFKDIEKLYEDIISQSEYDKKYKKAAGYETEANVVKFSEALTRGSDAVENFIKATNGATSLVAKEKQRYGSTSIGSLEISDKEYAIKANEKKKMDEFTRIRENDKWVNTIFKRQGDNLTSNDIQLRADGAKYGLTLDKYSEMVKYMAAEQKAMDLTPDAMFKKDVWGNVTNEIAEGAQKSWDTLYTNIRNLDRMIEDDDMDKAVKEGLHVCLRNMLSTAGGALKKESLEVMSNYRKELEDSVSDIKDVKLRNKIEEALNYTFTDITYDNKRQEAINKSGNPHLWAEALSKLTGIASNRVELEGAKNVISKFEKTIAPKNFSKQLMQTLVTSNKATAKELANIMKDSYIGTDFRGNAEYNWKTISDKFGDLAKEGPKDTRNGYVNALQQQISALDELTVGSLALGETAEEVRAGLTNMGVAFDYSLERGVDGLMHFSDASLEAASRMRDIYQQSLAIAKMNNIKADMKDAQKGKVNSARAEELFSKSIIGSELMTAEDLKNTYSELSSQVEELYKTAITDPIAKRWYKTGERNVTAKEYYEGKYGAGARAAYEKDSKYAETGEAGRKVLDSTYDKVKSKTITYSYLSIDKETEELLRSLKTSDGKDSLYDIARRTDGAEKLTRELSELSSNPLLSDSDKDRFFKLLEKLGVNIEDIVKELPKYTEARRKSEIATMGNRGANAFKASFMKKSDEWNIKNSIPDNFDSTVYLNRRLGLVDDAKFEERQQKMEQLSNEQIDRLKWLANEDLITQRRESALKTGQYDTSVFVNRSEKLVNKAYGLDENISKTGRTDFFRNYVAKDIEKMSKADLSSGGNSELVNAFSSVIAKNPDLILKAKDKGGNALSMETKGAVSELINASDDATRLEKLQYILKNISETDLSDVIDQVEKLADIQQLKGDRKNTIEELGKGLSDAVKNSGVNILPTIMKDIGKEAGNAYVNSKSMASVWKTAGTAMRGVLSSLSDQASQLMMNAGLSMIANPGSTKADWAQGFALIAASGLASFVSGVMSATEDSDSKNNDEYERLQKLKDNMADLLAQARNDAEYYEKELRNKKAISTNLSYSMQNVNDMILTPQGQFSTAPDDYIFAMKHPEDLTRGSAPVINFNVVNNSSQVETRTEQRSNADGSFDFVTIIDDVVQQGIAQGKYNDAFSAMQSGQRGTQTYA